MKKRILFILPNLYSGGAQKVVLTILNNLNPDLFEPLLIVIQDGGVYKNLIPENVSSRLLSYSRVRYSVVNLLRVIRKEKPDIIFSTLGHLNLILCMLRFLFPKRTALVIREGSIVTELFRQGVIPSLCSILYGYAYNNADAVICQSDYMLDDLNLNFGVTRKKMERIYNPVDTHTISIGGNETRNPFSGFRGPNIVGIGRMAVEKNFGKLILAFKEFLNEERSAQLWLIGEGELLGELVTITESLGIAESVHFTGFQANPYIWLKNADLFVLCSEYEGLPNVLLESLACDCPVIAWDCPGGTREVMELTGHLDRLLPFGQLHISKKMFERSRRVKVNQAIQDNFGLLRIVKAYEAALLRACN